MSFWEHLTHHGGRQILRWDPSAPLPNLKGCALALSSSAARDVTPPPTLAFAELCRAVAKDPAAASIEALVVGPWWDGYGGWPGPLADPMRDSLAHLAQRLPLLESLMLGDIIQVELMVSLITHCDYAPLLHQCPQLRDLHVRGSNGLRFSGLSHAKLESLTIETGNLRRETLADICAAKLPGLRHLTVFVGTQYYGGDTRVEDLMPLLSGRLFPNLRHLGLVNGDYADAVVEALAASPILERVESLDLSQGIMTDAGAECLLSCPGFSKIQRIDVRDNFISEEMARRLEALPCEIDTRHQALAEMDGERLGLPAHGDGYYCNIAE